MGYLYHLCGMLVLRCLSEGGGVSYRKRSTQLSLCVVAPGIDEDADLFIVNSP